MSALPEGMGGGGVLGGSRADSCSPRGWACAAGLVSLLIFKVFPVMKVQSEHCREFAKEREKGTKQPISHCPNVLLCMCAQSCPTLCLEKTPWTVAHQAPLSMGFFRQEDWSGLPFPPPEILPIQGSYPSLLRGQADSLYHCAT